MMVKITQLLSDKSREIQIRNAFDYIKLSREGLSVKQLYAILDFTQLSLKELASIISLSERQISRYTPDKLLRTDISAQLIQIAELYDRGYELFEEEEKFRQWMDRKIGGLGNEKPKSLLDTTFGIQMVIKELGRLEHGIVS